VEDRPGARGLDEEGRHELANRRSAEGVARHNAKLDAAAPKTTLPLDSAERKNYPLFTATFRYFPATLAWVARLCKIGNDKHNPGQELHHARGKSTDHADCILRHMMDMSEDFGKGVGRDENGAPQVVMIAWRANALCQEWLEKNEGAPLAPGARP